MPSNALADLIEKCQFASTLTFLCLPLGLYWCADRRS